MIGDIAWLDRFEPIGVNCEFGYVLERLGSKRPSLFRWNSIRPESLCKLLDARFAGAFAFENLTPSNEDMVCDTAYDWAFHSALKSDSERKFVLEGRELLRLHRIEKIKIDYEEKFFSDRLAVGGMICVLAIQRVADSDLVAVMSALDRFAGNSRNQLLAVTEPMDATTAPGQVDRRAPRIARGIVARMAPLEHADEADYENWEKILRAVA